MPCLIHQRRLTLAIRISNRFLSCFQIDRQGEERRQGDWRMTHVKKGGAHPSMETSRSHLFR
jgi:hypothetical protein